MKHGKGHGKIEKVMHEWRAGKLKSSSGKKVTSRRQAIAIGLSEARRAGAHIPRRRSKKKKVARRKKASKYG